MLKSDNIFDDLPEDFNDALIKDFDDKCIIHNMSITKRQIWKIALTWALEQDVSELLLNSYAEVVFEDNILKLKFKDELYNKFKNNTRD